ncbi:MAG: phenylphosphate carboxylase subunit gamma [Burkholderiaceae bacterium]|nr:phenylphosphate carboxylase subunit gamma [Sulfuritalea sp.]MCF8175435.1 phenylphosphate carboxylase subunit gamma [Burkholderiaceae bacterium]MCF8184309.1 phenylphosphate carboxylase subunit gamma [Polynucleobacter sp.]
MNQWEVFVMDMSELAEGKDIELSIRTLNQGKDKYTYKRVKCQVSAKQDKFSDGLQVRLGRGQLNPAKYSIKVLGEIERCPAKYL